MDIPQLIANKIRALDADGKQLVATAVRILDADPRSITSNTYSVTATDTMVVEIRHLWYRSIHLVYQVEIYAGNMTTRLLRIKDHRE